MLVEKIGEPAALELLAEECTELAHAALKLARTERGENPSLKTLEECHDAVIEEWADVVLCLGELADLPWNSSEKFGQVYDEKMDRMERRLNDEQPVTESQKLDARECREEKQAGQPA